MSLNNSLPLVGTMFVLAIIPGPSVFTVVARAMASGFAQGAVTTLGIVAGDIVFIMLAILGLWTLAETIEPVFLLVKYLGAAYLIYLGIVTWRTHPRQHEIEGVKEFSWGANFMCGLLITLSDPKAIVFYASFLPTYLDMTNLSWVTTGLLLLSATAAVGGAKLAYAYLADQAKFLFRHARAQTAMNALAGSVLIFTGIFLAIKG